MGNICRSPTAEGVLRKRLVDAGLADLIEVASAGTHAWHVGDPPDERSQAHAARRGYDLSCQRARRITEEDFERFDLVIAMDWENMAWLEAQCPQACRAKLKRLMEFARRHDSPVVPDPYYGGPAGFDVVLDYIEDAADGLVAYLRDRHLKLADAAVRNFPAKT